MYSLFIDTHSTKVIVVLYKHDKVLQKKEIVSNYNHSVITMPAIEEVLKDAKITLKNLEEIIVVNGPGSFTGIRIGVTIAKMLAFTLNIKIKVLSSLEVKAISIEHQDVYIVEREKNGVFVGHFNKNNELLENYIYLKNKEYNNYYLEDINIDYEKIINYVKKISPINPHLVNPLYVKKIEVQK